MLYRWSVSVGRSLVRQPQGEDEKDAEDAMREDHQLNEVYGIDVEVQGQPAGLQSRTKPQG